MSTKVKLNIFDIVGEPYWVSTEDGQKVYDKIIASFKSERTVELSFANHDNLISAFLNAAIGQLYNGDYKEAFLEENLRYVDLHDGDQELIDRVIKNAKRYFSKHEDYDRAWKEIGNVDEE